MTEKRAKRAIAQLLLFPPYSHYELSAALKALIHASKEDDHAMRRGGYLWEQAAEMGVQVEHLWLGERQLIPGIPVTRPFLVNPSPPLHGHRILQPLMSAAVFDAFVGDFEERYKLLRRKLGQSRADRWYWAELGRSAGPIILAALKRMVGLV
jgi:hypothetical protein